MSYGIKDTFVSLTIIIPAGAILHVFMENHSSLRCIFFSLKIILTNFPKFWTLCIVKSRRYYWIFSKIWKIVQTLCYFINGPLRPPAGKIGFEKYVFILILSFCDSQPSLLLNSVLSFQPEPNVIFSIKTFISLIIFYLIKGPLYSPICILYLWF